MLTSFATLKGSGTLQSLAGAESIEVDFNFEIQYRRRTPLIVPGNQCVPYTRPRSFPGATDGPGQRGIEGARSP